MPMSKLSYKIAFYREPLQNSGIPNGASHQGNASNMRAKCVAGLTGKGRRLIRAPHRTEQTKSRCTAATYRTGADEADGGADDTASGAGAEDAARRAL